MAILDTRIQRVEVNFGDASWSGAVSEGNRPGSFVFQYSTPGSYTASFIITTANNTRLRYDVPVTVSTPQELDGRIQATWRRFRDALAAGDSNAALACMTTSAAQNFAGVLTGLQSSLPQIVASFSNPSLVTSTAGMAEYAVTRDIDGQLTAFLIYFVRGTDGAWRIGSM
jgi:hypothetical protein